LPPRDAEIADIIDYERSSWGNHGKPVDATQVGTRAKPTHIILNTRYCAVIAEPGGIIGKPHVRVYLDDNPQPIIDRELPTDIDLDTLSFADGAHHLVIRAEGQNGREGVEEIPFVVHNGPGIIVSGLRPSSVRSGKVRFTVDAFSTDGATVVSIKEASL
jgi:hypothetical protein